MQRAPFPSGLSLPAIALIAALSCHTLVTVVDSALSGMSERGRQPAHYAIASGAGDPNARKESATIGGASRWPGGGSSARRTGAANPVDELVRRYEHASDKRVLFEELRDSGSPESFYFAAQILHDCVDVSEHGFTAVVDKFFATLSIDSPVNASRVAAFRQLIEPCTGFDGRQSTPAEIELLLVAGAHRGDFRAIAQLLSSARIAMANDTVAIATALLGSNDPYVIGGIARYLAAQQSPGTVIDGAKLDASESALVAMAWSLVACDYGASCGATNPDVLRACANDGLCEIHSVDELFRQTLAEDDAYGRGQYYRERILLALQRRDYASLGLAAARL